MNIRLFILLLIGMVAAPGAYAQWHTLIEELEETIPELMERDGVPGVALALIINGERVYEHGFGTGTFGKTDPITGTTGFNVASVSKSVVAWGVMKLAEQGRIELDAPIFSYISRWKLPSSSFNSEEVTVERVLSHTAGLYGEGMSDWRPTDPLPLVERSLNGLAGARPLVLRWKPGTRWNYSAGGSGLLQLMVEEVTGVPFETWIQEEVLDPLGMEHSTFFRAPSDRRGHSATPHHPRNKPTYLRIRSVTAAGSLNTTLRDLTRVAVGLYHNGAASPRGAHLLKPETIDRMLTAAPASGGYWGLGYAIHEFHPDVRIVGHTGGTTGYISQYWIDPDRGNGIIVFSNTTDAVDLDVRVFEMWRIWYVGEMIRRSETTPVDPSVLALLKGDWEGKLFTNPGQSLALRFTVSENETGSPSFLLRIESRPQLVLKPLRSEHGNQVLGMADSQYGIVLNLQEIGQNQLKGEAYVDHRLQFTLNRVK